jgi:uncharacterized membrane protein YeaQ/YmgE (transglycosylase-associated protein family)
MMVSGPLATLLLGVVGGVIGQVIMIVPAFRNNRPPSGNEWIASALTAALGAGVLLFGWDRSQPAFEIAILGAAFPSIFSNGVAALTKSKTDKPEETVYTGEQVVSGRGLVDFVARRF